MASGYYIRFLDYAKKRILLNRSGGAYLFRHPLWLQYFATLDPLTFDFNPATRAYVDGKETSLPASPVAVPTPALPASPAVHDITAEAAVMLDLAVPPTHPVRFLPCGHMQRGSEAKFCSVCGAPIPPADA